MYEIHEDRLVTRDGEVPGEVSGYPERQRHFAVVESEGGSMRLELPYVESENAILRIEASMSDGSVGFYVPDLLNALSALLKLNGLDVPEAAVTADRNERAAQVVERVCAELESSGDPTRETLATDLRTAVLSLLPS